MEIAISQFTSGEELLKCNKSIDILFLDIQMSGMDGMETARKLRNQNYKGYLLFITVLKEMVFHSFEVQAYDYLVKPIDKEYFEKTMERLLASMQSSCEAKLLIQRRYEHSIIAFDDIIYCEIINRKVYAVVTIEIMNLCYGISQSLSCVLSPIFFTENPELVSFMFMTVGNILAIIAAVFCYKLVYRCLVYDKAVGDKYILMILAPALLILLVGVYISLNIYGDTITIEADGKLLNVNPYQMLLIEIVGIISLFCILYAYQKLIKSFQVSREIALLEQEAHSLSQYVEEAKIRYENTKSFRHDVKNHITIVKELIRNENIEAALQYMGDMEHLAAEMSFPVNTNNPVLDILIGNKFGIAKSNRIEVQCSLILPYSCGINDIDFCIICWCL